MRQSIVQTMVARDLRQHATAADRVLWAALRNQQIAGRKFRRRAPIGPFIVDFVCLDPRLVIDTDWGPGRDRDPERDAWLIRQGFQILHLWDQDIVHNLSNCVAELERLLA